MATTKSTKTLSKTPKQEKVSSVKAGASKTSHKASPSDKTGTIQKKKINIALQGGGAHGAFSWGVLDRLLEDGRFEFDGLSGTSAGGMNALALIQGMMEGGNLKARETLSSFWRNLSELGKNSPINNRGYFDKLLNNYTLYLSPGFIFFDFLSRFFSPYDLNPLDINPLRTLIDQTFDFKKLRNYKDIKAFLCATHVHTGRLKIFSLDKMTPEKLQATACLPTLHHAITVDGDHYWDGGFIGNPAFFPLIYDTQSSDILYIKLNPLNRATLPTSTREISDRLNEITNNASVVREMRAINFITKLIDGGEIKNPNIKRVYMHMIDDDETFLKLGWSSKVNTEWEFLTYLFEKGRLAADKWIKEHFDDIGKRSTVDLEKEFV
ncbi:MAG TPA: patatin-like phospholipase family protein [Alphaproteobacteria bacterium]|nr:patatin-like phospholipase family protein [Alphaproteobacteria bacterium]